MLIISGWGQREGQMFKGMNLHQVVNKPQRSNTQYSEYKQYCIVIIKLAKKLRLIKPTAKKEG